MVMKIFRAFAGVIVGYLIFAVSSMMLVGMVMQRSGPVIMGLGWLALAAIGCVSGFVASKIAGNTRRPVGFVLAGLIAAATIANLAMQLGAEPTWYKMGTLLLTVPAIVVVSLRSSASETST